MCMDPFFVFFFTVTASPMINTTLPTPSHPAPLPISRPLAVGEARFQAHHAVGRHEAARAHRQGASARAADPLPRRADGGRRCRIAARHVEPGALRSEEHTSELQSLMRISYAVFCLKQKNKTTTTNLREEITET